MIHDDGGRFPLAADIEAVNVRAIWFWNSRRRTHEMSQPRPSPAAARTAPPSGSGASTKLAPSAESISSSR